MGAPSGGERVFPLLPLRDIVVFPHMMLPLYVGRQRSVRAVGQAMHRGRELVLAAQVNARTHDPLEEDIYPVGTLCQVVQHIARPDGTLKVLVEGRQRVGIVRFQPSAGHLEVAARTFDEPDIPGGAGEALCRTAIETFADYARLSKRLQPDVALAIRALNCPKIISDSIVAQLPLKLTDKQGLLESLCARTRLDKLLALMQAEIGILQVERKIRTRVKKQMERTEKEYYLNEQMRAIQRELGDRDEYQGEVGELEGRLAKKNMGREARARVAKEIAKLKVMAPLSAETTVVRNYIDWCLALPWNHQAKDKLSVHAAQRVLDQDHFGLKRPKERIMEYLAVSTLVPKMRGPILCLMGPPGVGKTSLARSIARATGRPFVRLALGGVRDEAEIRGHRRTYIGALPGKIVQGLKRAGVANPVMLLDEVDKMSQDVRGDPSSALLEVLDPEQNTAFVDHYLDIDLDLSQVMFIATANGGHGISAPLADRLEMIRLSGYTEPEKLAIARRYLVPKEERDNGLGEGELAWADRALKVLIRHYTHEAGVRALGREIASICRKTARQRLAEGGQVGRQVTARRVRQLLGPERHRLPQPPPCCEVGRATGLAWTPHGGSVLHVEAIAVPGSGKLVVTGKLGEVMQESARAALSYVRTRAKTWGLEHNFHAALDLHVHVPEGAQPKDGPSAGITIATALVSALTGVAVRPDVALTGEITLLGRVLPIGGLKEKALAAHGERMARVVYPKDNVRDLGELPKGVLRRLEMVPVGHMDEVLKEALALGSAGDPALGPAVPEARVGVQEH